MSAPDSLVSFPRLLSDYPDAVGGLWSALGARVSLEPFNAIATAIFALAIAHTFAAPVVTRWSHTLQHRADAEALAAGRPAAPSIAAELLHFFGEIELIFGLWALVLFAVMWEYAGWSTTENYFNGVNYTEPVFVIVIMALASTRPVMALAESTLRSIADRFGGSPAAWWFTILIVGPLLGSIITEPAAMTISALLLGRWFFSTGPGLTLRYATLGLLFVNISIGGTLTHFAAPPVLMVAHPWGWDTPYMLRHFGAPAVTAILVATVIYYFCFRGELRALVARADAATPGPEKPSPQPVPIWVTAVHVFFLIWTVTNAHSPVLFIGGFLIFLGFAQATAVYQSDIELKMPLLVGCFLAGLVIHGGLQGWWIQPMLARLPELPLFVSAAALTAFNDNALITYLGTLVPDLSETLKQSLVQGAVTAGGLTVIANAPNPAGQALLARYFDGIQPLKLLIAALVPTLIAAVAFRLM